MVYIGIMENSIETSVLDLHWGYRVYVGGLMSQITVQYTTMMRNQIEKEFGNEWKLCFYRGIKLICIFAVNYR